MPCDHTGPHSGASRYLPETSQLHLALVCEACGEESVQLGDIDYRPNARRLVGQLAELTARELGLGDREVARVRLAAMICDVGRSKIPQDILNKRGRLTDEEWGEIRRQPELAAALLSDASFDDIREWILCYRERIDGAGYPRGLAGDQIPLEARILAVVDAYVAMTSDRAHRVSRTLESAARELSRCAGSQFDAGVVNAFLSYLRRSHGLAAPTTLRAVASPAATAPPSPAAA